MALFRRFFYQTPPEGLIEIAERVYVFDSCFATDVVDDDKYRAHLQHIVRQLRGQFSDSSFLVFNFCEGQQNSQLREMLLQYNMTVMDYPKHYEGCPILSMELIHHFLRSSHSWISLDGHRNLLLLHCERGGWPTLAFMLAGFLIYRKLYTGEQRTLDLLHREAPKGLLRVLTPLNPMPSQIRYLRYIAQRNTSADWPPPDQTLLLDCIVLRAAPSFDAGGGCRPIVRIYGSDPHDIDDQSTRMLFNTTKKSKAIRYYKQTDCKIIKFDIKCDVRGDVVMECLHVNTDLDREEPMFRAMFNTAFISSNILTLGKDDIDVPWDAAVRYSKDFCAEVLFTDTEGSCGHKVHEPCLREEMKDGRASEDLVRVQELFNKMDWTDTKRDAAVRFLQQMSSENSMSEGGTVDSNDKGTVFEGEGNAEQVRRAIVRSDALRQTIPQPNFVSLGSASSPLSNVHNDLLPVLPPQTDTLPAAAEPVRRDAHNLQLGPSSSFSVRSHVQDAYSSLPLAEQRNPSPAPHELSSAAASCAKVPSSTSPPSVYKASPPPPLHMETITCPAPPEPSLTPSSSEKIPSPPSLSSAHEAPPPHPYSTEFMSARDLPRSIESTLTVTSLPPPTLVVEASPPQRIEEQSTASPLPGAKGLHAPAPSAVKGPPAPPPTPVAKGPPAIPPPPRAKPGPPPPPIRGGALGMPAVKTAAPLVTRKTSFKPFHWVKVTRALQGSLWEEVQTADGISKRPKIDPSELAMLFSAAMTTEGQAGPLKKPVKIEKVHLIEMQRSKNCEIMLHKVKMPLPDVTGAIMALDVSALDVDHVGNLLKFCPTNEEIETIKGYNGDKERLGKCEQFFLEMMKVPRVESKLRVFLFKLQLPNQFGYMQKSLNIVKNASSEVRDSLKFREVMHTILSIGNTLNQGTARGSAVGFKLESLLKLNEMRATNSQLTLMHYLDKVLCADSPDLLEFHKDLVHLEDASKVQLKGLAEEMQAINKSLEKVNEELAASESDGSVSEGFQENLKSFLTTAETDVGLLTASFSEAGRNADALVQYFGEDTARCTFEQVVSVLLNFVVMFKRAHNENIQLTEIKRKKAEKEAEQEKLKHLLSKRKSSIVKRDSEGALSPVTSNVAKSINSAVKP